MSIIRRFKLYCEYCNNFIAPNYCKKRNKLLPNGRLHIKCKSFRANTFFYCENYGQRYSIISCIKRKTCVKNETGFFISYQKCSNCRQFEVIEKISNLFDIKPIIIPKIKRRKHKKPLEVKFQIKRRIKQIKTSKAKEDIPKIKRRKKSKSNKTSIPRRKK